MRNFKLTLSYDGTDFQGWQTQPDCRTVQTTVQDAIEAITRERVRLTGSGRTDAGVHAMGQVANFHCSTKLSAEVLLRAIPTKLPVDVGLKSVEEVSIDFDACRDAVRKMYQYRIYDGATHDPFIRKYAYACKYKLDAELMHAAAQALLGKHDFHSFETHWPNRKSSVRTILQIHVLRQEQTICLQVEADGFLYNMVRAVAGTLIQIGRGYFAADSMAKILAAEDRNQAGPTAPPEGLCLMKVYYA
jgi:tRNA pseudouridine38-40 synthase